MSPKFHKKNNFQIILVKLNTRTASKWRCVACKSFVQNYQQYLLKQKLSWQSLFSPFPSFDYLLAKIFPIAWQIKRFYENKILQHICAPDLFLHNVCQIMAEVFLLYHDFYPFSPSNLLSLSLPKWFSWPCYVLCDFPTTMQGHHKMPLCRSWASTKHVQAGSKLLLSLTVPCLCLTKNTRLNHPSLHPLGECHKPVTFIPLSN